MNDIEKKAAEYVANAPNRSMYDAFLAGAAYALGNQWRDAEKEKPKDKQVVLIFTTYIGANSGEPRTLIEQFTYFEQYGFWLKERSERRLKLKVLAWMEIPEYKPKEE